MEKLSLLLFLAFSIYLPAQNLVVNPSFEEFKKKQADEICDYSKGRRGFNTRVYAWNGFFEQTPDIVLKSDSSDCIFPKAHEGSGMLGIITYLPAQERGTEKDYRELVQGKLKQTLVVGETYHFQFWVSQSNKVADHHLRSVFWTDIQTKPVGTNNIGLLFLEHPFMDGTKINQTLSEQELYPQFNVEEVIQTQEGEWQKIAGSFVAKAPYQYFILGNMYDAAYTETSLNEAETTELLDHNASIQYKYQMLRRIAYYLIDDVYIGINPPPAATPNIAATLKEKKVYTFQAVHFESGKYELLPSSFPELNELALFLKENPQLRVEIGGHTDSVGNDQANQRLSQNRANAVRNYLIQKGAKHTQLTHKGYGERQAIADNKTAEGRQQNRRVECKILNQ